MGKQRVYLVGGSDDHELYKVFLTREAWLKDYRENYEKACEEYAGTEFDPKLKGSIHWKPAPEQLMQYVGGPYGSPVLFSTTWWWEESEDGPEEEPRKLCPDCGEDGHTIGDMNCPMPKDHPGDDDIHDTRPDDMGEY